MKCVPFDDVCSCCLPNKKKQCLCESVRLMLYVGQKLTGTVSVSAKQSRLVPACSGCAHLLAHQETSSLG